MVEITAMMLSYPYCPAAGAEPGGPPGAWAAARAPMGCLSMLAATTHELIGADLSAVEEIRAKLEAYLRVLEEEIESLRSALSALDAQEAASAAATPPAPPQERPVNARNGDAPQDETRNDKARSRARPTTRARKSPRAASAELEQLLAQTGGVSAVELARQTGTDYGEVLARIQELERAGRR